MTCTNRFACQVSLLDVAFWCSLFHDIHDGKLKNRKERLAKKGT